MERQMTMAASPTNEELAELLEVSHATVSRIRSGDRLPSLAVMDRIRTLLNWSLDDQADARTRGVYHEQFCKRVDQGALNRDAQPR
jgi:transcriptional regulator with XRE-family HTH domain